LEINKRLREYFALPKELVYAFLYRIGVVHQALLDASWARKLSFGKDEIKYCTYSRFVILYGIATMHHKQN
jgi:hypothetical protein